VKRFKNHYQTPDELEARVIEYFNEAPDKARIQVGFDLEDVTLFTLTGLILFLGFKSRQSFYDYEKREGFGDVIKWARLLIENQYEANLTTGCSPVQGTIFALRQFGWHDNREVNLTNDGGKFDYSGADTDDLVRRAVAAQTLEDSEG